MKKILIPAILLLIALLPRLYKLNTPLADWHSWRQADTAAVTRNFAQDGIDLLHPKYDDLSSIPSGIDNPEGYRMVEFPFVNALIASSYSLLKCGIGLVAYSRLFSIAFSLGSTLLLYYLVSHLSGRRLGFLSALVFALLPFNIFYSRVVLPEPALIFFTLLALYLFAKQKLLFSSLALALALLLKPTILIIYGPMFLYLSLKHKKKNSKFLILNSIFWLSALVPIILWRLWIRQFPAGIPNFTWLLNSTAIRFRPAWFRWLFADRLGRLILGYWGLIPFGLGLIIKAKNKAFYFAGLFGSLLYLIIFATGNVTHDYYQIILIPIISIFTAFGLEFFLTAPRKYFSRPIAYCLFAVVSLAMLAFSWFHIRDFYNINNPAIVEAGQYVDQNIPSNAKVIAPYGGDTAFLFQTNRQGWPIGNDLNRKIDLGATHFLTVNFDDEFNQLNYSCTDIYQTNTFALIDLKSCDL